MAVFTRAPLALVILLLPALASARSSRAERAEDHVYLEASTMMGLFAGGALDTGPLFGVRGALGVRVSEDVALELQAYTAGDGLTHGYSSAGWAFGAVWFPRETLRLSAGVRYRRFADGIGLGEVVGEVLGHVFIAPLCPPDDRSCPQAEFEELDVWDMGLDLALGSQWHWSVFTLGVEWIGLYRPMVVAGASRTYSNDEVSIRRDAPDIGAGDMPMEVRFLGFSLGASF